MDNQMFVRIDALAVKHERIVHWTSLQELSRRYVRKSALIADTVMASCFVFLCVLQLILLSASGFAHARYRLRYSRSEYFSFCRRNTERNALR
jgi:hypothetical protein